MKMTKIRIIYSDGTAETREIIKNSIPETTLKAAKETGKQVIEWWFCRNDRFARKADDFCSHGERKDEK